MRLGGKTLVARQRGRKSKSRPRRRRSVSVKKSLPEPRCRIAILGVGGAGNRIVSNLVDEAIAGTRCIAINTDLKDLNFINATQKVLIGEKVTCGLSAGGNPETGKAAAQESRAILETLADDVDVAFVVAGLGGGTGTGAAPVVAEIARRKGAVVVGVVATPFKMNEYRSGFIAEALGAMQLACDTLVVADNDRIRRAVAGFSASETREVADQYLVNMIKGIAETLSEPSMINLNIADFKTIVKEGGVATYGVGESDAPNRAEEAVQNALSTSLFNVDCADATGALIQVSGDPKMTIQEVDRVKELVEDKMGRGARVAWGARVNPNCEGSLKVTLVMTGVNSPHMQWGLGNMLNELYDLESSYSISEKSLPVDLGLDQIEGVED
jgi:cell division protein FtsZ